MPEILQLLWALLVIIAVLALAYLFTRYGAGRLNGMFRPRRRRMTVVEQVPLGRDQRLVLVRMGDTLYLLGVTPGGVSRLEKLPASELEALEEPPPCDPPQDGAQGMSFGEALKKVIDQRKKSGRP